MALDAAQPAVSSSSTLWAQASKEWVIPAKPKPGRKPKKESAPPKESQEVDSKGRRVQNRAAQRAFRERKQSQLADLQARVQSYEQGDIERNVALQQVSKRLKEENEQLKDENAALKDEIARLKEHADTAANTKSETSDVFRIRKRWRDDSVGSMLSVEADALLESMSRKRFRADTESPAPSTTPARQISHNITYMHSPPSLASSPDSNGISGGSFSPVPFVPLPAPSASVRSQPVYSTSAMLPPRHRDITKTFDLGSAPPFDTFDCGLCTDNTPCVCREIAMQQANLVPGIGGSMQDYVRDYSIARDQAQTILKIEEACEAVPSSSIIDIPPASEATQFIDATSRTLGSTSPQPLSLKNIPAYQPAVQLRRNLLATQQEDNNAPFQIRLPSPEPAPVSVSLSRSVPLPSKGARRLSTGKVWQITPAAPMCSGDPSNCPACKDDDFGKAFCRALGDSAGSTSSPCASCPNPEACGKALDSACMSGSPSASGPSSITNDLKMIELTPANPKHHRASSTSSSLAHSSKPSTTHVSLSAATSPVSLTFRAETSSDPSNLATSNSTDAIETIPVNEAWARLKSHPNIAFADLSMLADVVARRTKCSGPIAVIHPAPGSITPEREAARSPAVPESETAANVSQEPAQRQRKDDAPILLTDPHAHFKAQEQQRAQFSSSPVPVSGRASTPALASTLPPTLSVLPAPRGMISSASSIGPNAVGRPALVPQEELRECGRRRIREVDAAGVHEALRILDAQFGKQR